MASFRLPVQDPWFGEIAAGRKTVEGRVGHEGKFDPQVGKIITVVAGVLTGEILPPERQVRATVLAARHYDDLDGYLVAEGWEKIAPHTGSDEAARKAYGEIYVRNEIGETMRVFSPERIAERGGINALDLAIE